MANSVNGWTVISYNQLNRNPFPGTKIVPKPGIRRGDVATILHYLGSRFNAKVERLYNPGCWGFVARKIPGTNSYSNHASGTAIDLNAPTHPWKKKGTFTYKQRLAIRSILNFFEGAVVWGGDWSIAYVDEMHFEIYGGGAKIKKIANKIRNNSMDRKEGFRIAYASVIGKNPPGALYVAFLKQKVGPATYVHRKYLTSLYVKKSQYNIDIKNLNTRVTKLEKELKESDKVENNLVKENIKVNKELDKCAKKLHDATEEPTDGSTGGFFKAFFRWLLPFPKGGGK